LGSSIRFLKQGQNQMEKGGARAKQNKKAAVIAGSPFREPLQRRQP